MQVTHGRALLVMAGALLLAACGPTARSVSLEPERIRAGDGRWVERRVNQYASGRVEAMWYVYRDSAGNFRRHGPERHYYRNGQLKYREEYRDGRLAGISEFWYENGAKQGELPFAGGKPHGTALTWYPDGKKKSEKHWVHGQLHGPVREWDRKGRLAISETWERNRKLAAGAAPSRTAPDSAAGPVRDSAVGPGAAPIPAPAPADTAQKVEPAANPADPAGPPAGTTP